MRLFFAFFLCFLLQSVPIEAKRVFYDKEGVDMSQFFIWKNSRYVIQYHHTINSKIVIPEGCEIMFKGGGLSGNIEFLNTKLSGDVNLKGSSIKGSVKNKQLDASWFCAMDGETDDAAIINEMIEVCGSIFFPKGRYRLESSYNPEGKVPVGYGSSIKAHIGIRRNGTHLVGEPGTVFVTQQPLGTICIFSQPNQIKNSVSNIVIKNIEFEVHNDGENFHEFMHTIKTIGVNGLLIEGCFFNDFWGDAICLSHYGDTPATGERTRNQNIKILNNYIEGGSHYSNRNGVSVVGGKNVLIKGNVIKKTSRKDMPGGIDVEPNNSAYTVENIRIENNDLEGIKGGGGAISIISPQGGPAHRIYIVNNIIRDSNTGFFIYLKSDNVTDTYVIKDNKVNCNTRPYRFEGEGRSRNWIVKGNIFDKPCKQEIPGNITVSNLVLKNNKKKD